MRQKVTNPAVRGPVFYLRPIFCIRVVTDAEIFQKRWKRLHSCPIRAKLYSSVHHKTWKPFPERCLGFQCTDLEKLSEEEREVIRLVAQRSEDLQNNHDGQLKVLKAEIVALQRARDAEVDLAETKSVCTLCMTPLGWILPGGATCPSCNRKVCSACRLPVQLCRKKKWMCTLCAKEWMLRIATGDWKDVVPPRTISSFILRTLQTFRKSLKYNVEPAKLQKAVKGAEVVETPVRHFYVGSSDNIEDILNRTVIECSPQIPRRSLHGRVRPLPLPAVDVANDVPHSPTLKEKFVHHLQEASHLIQIHSDAFLYPKKIHSSDSHPRRIRSCESLLSTAIGTPKNASRVPEPNGNDKDVLPSRTQDPVTPQNDSPNDVKTFLYTATTYSSIHPTGLFASTPHSHCGKENDFVLPLKRINMDNISLSTVDSDLNEHRIPVKRDISGDVLMQVGFDYDKGMLEVFILRCRNLPSTSKKSVKFPNPYVKVYLCGSKGGRIKRRTDKKLKTQNPVYNELLSFPVVDRQAADWFLHVAVCCKEGFFRQVELLGSTTMLITEDIIQKEHPMWVPLHTSDVLGLI